MIYIFDVLKVTTTSKAFILMDLEKEQLEIVEEPKESSSKESNDESTAILPPYQANFRILAPKNQMTGNIKATASNSGAFVLFVISMSPLQAVLMNVACAKLEKSIFQKQQTATFVEVLPAGGNDFIILAHIKGKRSVVMYYDTKSFLLTEKDVFFEVNPLFAFFHETKLHMIFRDSKTTVFIHTMLTMNTMQVEQQNVNGPFFPSCNVVLSSSKNDINGKVIFHTDDENYPIVVFFINENIFKFITVDQTQYSILPGCQSMIHLMKNENMTHTFLVSNFANKESSAIQIYNIHLFQLPEVTKMANFNISGTNLFCFSLTEKAIVFSSEETKRMLQFIIFGEPDKPPKPLLINGNDGFAVFEIPKIQNWFLLNELEIVIRTDGRELCSINLLQDNLPYQILKTIKFQLKQTDIKYEAFIIARNNFGNVASDHLDFIICSLFKWTVRAPLDSRNDKIYHIEWDTLCNFKEISIHAKTSYTMPFEHLLTLDDSTTTGIDIQTEKNYLFFRVEVTLENGEVVSSTQKRKLGNLSSRIVFSMEQKMFLEQIFNENRNPTGKDYKLIATELEVPEKSVRIWFANKRHRERNIALET